MVKVLKMFETEDSQYIEAFYSLMGGSLLQFRTFKRDGEIDIEEPCTSKEQIRELRDFLNTMLGEN